MKEQFRELLAVFENAKSNTSIEISGKRRELMIVALRIAIAELPCIPHASDTERRIVGKLVEDLLAAGFALSVNDGEEVTVSKSKDPTEIYAALSSTDTDLLMVHSTNDVRDRWIRLVWGNDCDVISDYLTSLEPFLAGAEALAEELST